jgi:hypothetical protein
VDHQRQLQPTGRYTAPPTNSLFAWLISNQPAVLFSQSKPTTSNQPAVLFSQNKPAPAISHQPNEQATSLEVLERRPVRLAYQPPTSSNFLSEKISHQQPVSSTFLSEQININYQPPAK